LTTQLTNFSLSEVVTGRAEDQRITLYDSERQMIMQDCIQSKPLFQTQQALGEDNVLKIVVFVIWNFQKTLKLSNDKSMDATDLVIAAGDFIDTYTHDSITDLVFALRQARHDGKIFYNKFSQQDLNAILKEHFEKKAKMLEVENKTIVPQSNNLQLSQITSKLLENSKSVNPATEDYKTLKAREKCRQMIEKGSEIKTKAYWDEQNKLAIENLKIYEEESKTLSV
jgi:hypothetical protein